ncbi:MAG: acyl-CoA dehydrogenase family protein [Pseudomonadota bacterium]
MNFDFSDDQKFLKEQANKFLTDKCGTDQVRKVLDDDSAAYHKDLWVEVAEMGWMGVAIPEAHGGLGLGALELCVLAEELGRALAPIPFSSTVYYAANAIARAGDDAQKSEYLPKIAAGEAIGCYAASEGPGPVDAGKLDTVFDSGMLSGVKTPVLDGDCADFAIVLAKEGSGACWVLVDLGQAGVTRETLRTLDPTRNHAVLSFDGAGAQRLGRAGEGASLHEDLMDRVAVLLSFEQVGGAVRCLEEATAYAKERYAFGKPIAGNQAIKHRLADMWVKNEVARSNAYYGAWALSTDAPELPEAAAAARLAGIDAYWFGSKEGIQIHGGMGFTWEVDCHLFYRRAKLLSVQCGSGKIWKEKLVRALELKNAA